MHFYNHCKLYFNKSVRHCRVRVTEHDELIRRIKYTHPYYYIHRDLLFKTFLVFVVYMILPCTTHVILKTHKVMMMDVVPYYWVTFRDELVYLKLLLAIQCTQDTTRYVYTIITTNKCLNVHKTILQRSLSNRESTIP